MLEQIFTNDDVPREVRLNGINASPMRNFYRDKTVFLTGGTGFLGKLFIEKLLRCEVREIVLLVRAKRNRTPRERLQRQFEREAIYVTYAKDPNWYWDRLKIVEGSLEYDNLGLSEADIAYLQRSVDIVIHSAADVRFDVSLTTHIRTNVFGGNELLKIALGMSRLVSYLFISTAYSNCIHEVVEEKYYDNVGVDPMTMVRLAESVDEDQLNVLCRKIIQPWPNTYTYTKMLTENLVRQYCDRLPVAIVRPSIVISTLEDPIVGWTDNVYGLNGVLVGVGCGLLRVLHCHAHCHADIIPADLVVNSSLAVIWHTSTQPAQGGPVEHIFNCTTRSDNPFTYQNVFDYGVGFREEIPALQSLWYPTYNGVDSPWVYYILQLFYHFLPALFFDTIAMLKGMEPKVLFLNRKVLAFSDVLDFFTTNEWVFRNEKMRHVYDAMTADDQTFFPVDIRRVRWAEFFPTYLLGLRQYIVRESLDNLEQAKRKFRLLKAAHYVVLALVYVALAYVGYVLLGKGLTERYGFRVIK
ncbi:fatty acyl-CoA reductase wat [Culex quinquefasciatus]|uniref:fatty acyl-CoA reductase wat n=1 Tax=Culex quinquefasciatus TaxID=7176 RepID=UPI0018E32C29|nr:fatty acyl-CoA reductase wat [Culex quinquefasciatus]